MTGVLLIALTTAVLCYFTRHPARVGYMSLAGALALAAHALPLAWRASGLPPGEVVGSGLFTWDAFSAYVAAMVVVISLASAMYSVGYMEHEHAVGLMDLRDLRRYFSLFHLFVFTMLLVVSTSNLALMWIGIEATTIVSALLIGMGYHKRPLAIEAAWKYLILCTVGITFALLGVFLIYYASAQGGAAHMAVPGGGGSLDWRELRERAAAMNPATLKLAFVFILVGYGTKAGLAPMHNWLPDAHSEAPSPISALLSGVLLNTSFYGIIRVTSLVDPAAGAGFTGPLLVAFGLISIGVAAVFMLYQDNYKRLLAYSSIEHMGIVALGFGLGTPLALFGAVLHMANHAVSKPLLFFTSGKIQAYYKTTKIESVSGVLQTHPLWGMLTFLGVLSLAGAPPFNMFVSEFSVLAGGAGGGRWYVVGVFLFFLVLVFYGLLSAFGRVLLGEPSSAPMGAAHGRAGMTVPTVLSAASMLALGAAIVALGLWVPGPLEAAIRASIAALGR